MSIGIKGKVDKMHEHEEEFDLWEEDLTEEFEEHVHHHHHEEETATAIEGEALEPLEVEEIMTEEDKKYLREKFAKEMENPVKIVLLKSDNCDYCELTEKLLNELAPLADGKIKLEVRMMNEEDKKKLGVDHGPVILIGEHGEVRYTGAPLGEEGWAFIETIVIASTGNHGFEDWEEDLKNLKKTVRIETVVTPSCPYCPYAVLLANRIALASKGKVISDTIEAYEFPHIADKYNVTAVPTIIISVEKPYTGEVFSIGVPKEVTLLKTVLKKGL